MTEVSIEEVQAKIEAANVSCYLHGVSLADLIQKRKERDFIIKAKELDKLGFASEGREGDAY